MPISLSFFLDTFIYFSFPLVLTANLFASYTLLFENAYINLKKLKYRLKEDYLTAHLENWPISSSTFFTFRPI